MDEQKFQSIRKHYFSKIEYIDGIDFPISNEEFGDLEHLNFRGAKKFSIFFNTIVQKNSQIIRKTTNNWDFKSSKKHTTNDSIFVFIPRYFTYTVNWFYSTILHMAKSY